MRSLLLILTTLVCLAGSGHAQELEIRCGDGFTPTACELAKGSLTVAIQQLSPGLPGWRWVIVPAEKWEAVATSFGISPTTPAFSSLGIQSTYIHCGFVLFDTRLDEHLQSYSSRTGIDRLRWVVAHELGHIVCGTKDEHEAESAAKKIQARNRNACPVRPPRDLMAARR
ncbi:MAG TPA: hypothetical protein VN577_14990 [Terriglobales bacterium]|nr:hypothetical protein [Terriglobales bacterium]